jgi:hypothetical protein
MLWPRPIQVLAPGNDAFAHRGVYLALGEGPKKTAGTLLFRNEAGSIWSLEAGEPR